MSSSALLESIEILEQEIDKFAQVGESYEELSSLIEEIPNILKCEQLILYHRKKYEELKEIVKKNKTMVKTIQCKLKSLPASSKPEKFGDSNEQEGKIFKINLNKLQIYMKKDCCEAVKHLDNIFKAEFEAMEAIVEGIKQEILNSYPVLPDSQKLIQASTEFSALKDSTTLKSVETIESRCISIINQKLSNYENTLQCELNSLKSQLNI